MPQVTISLPEKTALALNAPLEKLGGELLLAAAVKLYEIGKLSSGAAAELAGVPKPLFLTKLAEYGVATFDLSEEEMKRESSIG